MKDLACEFVAALHSRHVCLRLGWTFGFRRPRFPTSMTSKPDSALLIVAHGSTLNPDSSAPTWTHAREIQRRKIFADVRCAFWKEEPSLRDAQFFFADEMVREVFIVPNFISEGYFTQTVIPRELELDSPITTRANGQIWIYCEPVGKDRKSTRLNSSHITISYAVFC